MKPEDSVPVTFAALGEEAVVAIFGDGLSVQANERACRFADAVTAARLGYVTDVVPSFAACAVHYRALAVRLPTTGSQLPHDVVVQRLQAFVAAKPRSSRAAAMQSVEIPVCYGGPMGPDLEEAADACGITPEELVQIHSTTQAARVFMIGFLPGAPYIGVHDERLRIRRRASPRKAVAAGSIGIANRQTVIYPEQAPGGWNLIGRTPLRLFDIARPVPALLRPGTPVTFRVIDEAEFDSLLRSQDES